MHDLTRFLVSQAKGELLPWQIQQEAASRFGLTLHEVEHAVFSSGLLPARYQRNRQSLSVEQQSELFNSRVVVIGCGGLGGYVLEELARLGVGHIVAVDFDFFEENNLNRQILATFKNFNILKVAAAADRIANINPAVQVTTYNEPFAEENAAAILEGCNVCVDALDSIPARLLLSRYCSMLGIPLVHGAICGWYGQVTTQYPGEDTLEAYYRSSSSAKGMETVYGNPAFTPAVTASIQVAEVSKVLLRVGSVLRRKLLCINLLDMEMDVLQL
jgi:molybdopterin/thiamine biosynthesis adenylyltransferase